MLFRHLLFPDESDEGKELIRKLGEQLDAHRKRQQAQHPQLTLTEMYNVLAKLRAGSPLSDRERTTHEAGLVTVLKNIHDELDAAVCDAYGFTPNIADEEILQRLVRLNAERAAEERAGHVRWLRPAYQHPAGATQSAFAAETIETEGVAKGKIARAPFPKGLAEQARAVRQMLGAQPSVVTPAELAQQFTRAPVARVTELLETLVSLGQARAVEGNHYVA